MSLQDAMRKMGEGAASLVKNGYVVGLGSGSAVAAFVNALGVRMKEEGLKITAIPTSIQIELIAENLGFTLERYHRINDIDIVIDGADQIDSMFNMIKGGGGAHHREKVFIEASKKRVIVADESKYLKYLGRSVPMEVSIFARHFVWKRLETLGGKPRIRTLEKGYPYFTENGNIILDTEFGEIRDPPKLESQLQKIPGVVANGIFTMKIDVFFKAKNDGTVEKIER